MRKILILILLLILLSNSAYSQEEIPSEEKKEVCLVYFVSSKCGDECGLTDEFMNGLINEYYGRLTAIKYYVDVSYENLKIFEAYQKNYNIPSQFPLVLFGKNYYLLGIDEIYNKTEKIIFNFLNENGTNCPLESGYIPPNEARERELPGSPEIIYTENNQTKIEEDKEKEIHKDFKDLNEKRREMINFDEIIFEEKIKETIFSLAIIILALMLVSIAIFFVWKKS
ncbi:MAG: hypothetical protein QW051_00350 [Candidatus Aenigmatarchaeota archaeon]